MSYYDLMLKIKCCKYICYRINPTSGEPNDYWAKLICSKRDGTSELGFIRTITRTKRSIQPKLPSSVIISNQSKPLVVWECAVTTLHIRPTQALSSKCSISAILPAYFTSLKLRYTQTLNIVEKSRIWKVTLCWTCLIERSSNAHDRGIWRWLKRAYFNCGKIQTLLLD